MTKLLNDTIICPKCGNAIQITETLRSQLTEQTKLDVQREFAQEKQALVAERKVLEAKEQAVAAAEESLEAKVLERLKLERTKLSDEALKKARAEVGWN
jgi:uncharacterized Zn finger protein (UPF0148 family)